MNLILIGPPGAGKGTQADFLVDKLELAHISTGDLLRRHVREGTELGKKAKSYMDSGQLVPDQLVIDMMSEHLDDLNSFVYGAFIDNQAIRDVNWGAQGVSANDTLLGIFLGNHDVTRFSSYVAGQEDPGDAMCQVFHSGSPPQPSDWVVGTRFQVLFHSPLRGSFRLSLTVLVHYRSVSSI